MSRFFLTTHCELLDCISALGRRGLFYWMLGRVVMLIDPKSSTPIFRQIADQLRQAIESKVYKPGEMLPSLRAMAIDINVNPNTVQRAYEALEREGVVETRRGVGIFVRVVNRSQVNATEQRLSQQLSAAIRQGVKSRLTPDTIRAVFEDALQQILQEVKKC